ncbi:MAG: ABC-three component system protein [Ilumatobacteraceae bacterium]
MSSRQYDDAWLWPIEPKRRNYGGNRMSTDSGNQGEANLYSAASSALGYLAQIEYALLLTLRRLDVDIAFEISIETLDDIVFHDGDNAVDLLQSKHRVDRTASLASSSSDVWKTLHNWIVSGPVDASLTLFTNATAPTDSAMFHLRGGEGRSVGRAATSLESIARTSENVGNLAYYKSFLALSSDERLDLLSRVTLVDAVPAVADLGTDLELAVRKSTKAAHRSALIERLRGWWFAKVYDHLERVALGQRDRILSEEVESELLSLAQQLSDEDLPIDYYDMPEPTDADIADDERVFVHQLRLISLASARVRQCVYDHNRAFAQRSRWEREKLLHVGELKAYENRLKDEWRRFCLPDSDQALDDEPAAVADARARFLRLDQSTLPSIRRHVSAGYVANGSLHILADRLELGWHPDWLARLREILPELGDEDEGAA